MPRLTLRHHALLQAVGLLGLATLGAEISAGIGIGSGIGPGPGASLAEGLGAMPALVDRPAWSLLGGLAIAGSLGGWMWWRQQRLQRRFTGLRLAPLPPSEPPHTTLEGVLRFATTAPLEWCARRGEWCLDLARSGSPELPWRMNLRRADLPEEPVPLAQAATLDAVLHLSRRLFAQRALMRSGDASLREAAELLECDLEFLLPARSQMTALAEGGYALQDEKGCRAISAQLADTLLAYDIARRQNQAENQGTDKAPGQARPPGAMPQ